MTTIAAIAIVVAVVQFFKKLAPAFIQGSVAVAIAVVASVAVTLYKFINEGLPLTLAAITFLIPVIIGALSTYSLVKVAGGK